MDRIGAGLIEFPHSIRIEPGKHHGALALYRWHGPARARAAQPNDARQPCILLAHPSGFNGLAWAPLARLLAGHGYAVWSIDLRGHGESDPEPPNASQSEPGYHWRGFADDIFAAAQYLGNPKLFGIGHSMGGTAMLLAEIACPGTFQAMWHYEPIVFATDIRFGIAKIDGDFPIVRAAARRQDRWDSRDQALASYGSKPPLSELQADALSAYVEGAFRDLADGGVGLRCRPEIEAQIFRMGLTHDAWEHLGELGIPVTIACGDHGEAMSLEHANDVASRIPGGRVSQFDGLGHFGPLEDPDRIALAIFEELARLREIEPIS